jgi:hydroxymethylbilane synthase
MNMVRAGTRGSPLALIQTRGFLGLLGYGEEVVISTTGDAVQDRPLASIGGKGLFAKEIHEALLDGRVDCAVHSLKDLETELPPGVVLACVLKREDPRDALVLAEPVATSGDPFSVLPPRAVMGTSSVRRQAQLLHRRPDLTIGPMRGNVQTRLRKLREGTCQATLLAVAGLNRLGMALPEAVVLEPEVMLPAAAQGIIGITAREADIDLLARLAAIEDRHARIAATAERAVLAMLDGSCRTPIGAHARIGSDGAVTLTALVARADGGFLLRRELSGGAADAEKLGRTLGASLRADAPADLFR